MADISELVLKIDSTGVIEAKKNLDDFGNSANKAQGQVTTLDGLLQRLSPTAIAATAGVLGVVKAFNGMVNASKAMLQANSTFETLERGLQQVTQSASKGSAIFEDLRKFSLETTFGVDTLASASNAMLTLGVSTGELKDKITMLGNAAQGETGKFNALVDIYTKVKATGRATGIQVQQLSRLLGVSMVQQLGKSNASAEELDACLQKMTTDGRHRRFLAKTISFFLYVALKILRENKPQNLEKKLQEQWTMP